MILVQSDTNPQIENLLSSFKSIPPNVNTVDDASLAGELISEVSRILGAGPGSRPAVHPRPDNAGLQWDNVGEDAQIKYDAVLDELTSDSPHVTLDYSKIEEAQATLKVGLKKLWRLPQQGFSGTVFRS